MYGSVEMLLKFYAENFPFEFTGQESREKSVSAHAQLFFQAENFALALALLYTRLSQR